jgi:hypothetical protein
MFPIERLLADFRWQSIDKVDALKHENLLSIFSCFFNHFLPASFIFEVYSITVPRESKRLSQEIPEKTASKPRRK